MVLLLWVTCLKSTCAIKTKNNFLFFCRMKRHGACIHAVFFCVKFEFQVRRLRRQFKHKEDRVRIIGVVLTILLIIVGIAFTALNAQSVEINYLIGEKNLPLAVILLASLTLGIVLSVLLMGFSLLKLKAKNKWLESKLKKAQEQLTQFQQ